MKQNTDTKQKKPDGETPKSFNIYVPYEKEGGEETPENQYTRRKYIFTPSSSGANALGSVYVTSRQLAFNFGKAEIEKNGSRFVIYESIYGRKLVINGFVQKVRKLILQKVATQYHFGSKVKENIRVFVSPNECIEWRKTKPSMEKLPSVQYETSKKLAVALDVLSGAEQIVEDGNGKEISIPFRGGARAVDKVKDVYVFTVSSDYINTLNVGTFTPQAYYELPDDDPVPCYLYDKLVYHYGMDCNKAKGTQNIISLKALFNWLENPLTTFNTLREKGEQRHSKQRVKIPFERALNLLEEGKLIKWEYLGEDKKPLTEQEKKLVGVDEEYTYKCHLKFELTDADAYDEARKKMLIAQNRTLKLEAGNETIELSDEQFVKEFGSLLEESSCK